MIIALKAGATYFAIVYLAGFVLGTVRVLLVVPRVGELTAVLLETPLILAVSWTGSRWCVDRFAVPQKASPRVVMGSSALVLLLLGELGVSLFAFGRPWADTLAAFRSPPGLIGLSAQGVFALLPLFQAILPQRRRQ